VRILWPYLLERIGKEQTKEVETFFGRRMKVVLPEVVSVRIWRYGVFEEDVCFYLISQLRLGDTFIDVGGHFGFFSLLARELVGETGMVVTFEPMPDTRNILTENMLRYSAPAQHHLVAAAAGSVDGRIKFKDFGLLGSAFATSKTVRDPRFKQVRELDVDVRTIDSVVEQLSPAACRLIKIDAENAEYEVVQGALGVVRRLRPAVVIEAGDLGEGRGATRSVIDVLIGEGYRPYEFHDWAIRPHALTGSYGYQNLLLLPEERRNELLVSRE
jgi:FkbM family methyltransferase